MTKVCNEWGISCLNISKCPLLEIRDTLNSLKPRIIIASIEAINDPSVQMQFAGLKLCYVAVDEAQVSIFVFPSKLKKISMWMCIFPPFPRHFWPNI